MGSSCSSSQSAKDSTSVRSEDLAMDQAVTPPEKTTKVSAVGATSAAAATTRQTSSEGRPPDIRTKGPSVIESEYSSLCDDGMSTSPPGVFPSAVGVKSGIQATASTELPALANLHPAIRRLLEGQLEEEGGRTPEGGQDKGVRRREREGGKSIALYVCAGEESSVEVGRLQSQVTPSLRVLARSLGWELSIVLCPALSAANCSNVRTTAAHVQAVANTVLTGPNRYNFVVPLVFLHDTLGSVILPSCLSVAHYNLLLDASVGLTDQQKEFLHRWYRPGYTTDDTQQLQAKYLLVPETTVFTDYNSRDGLLRHQARTDCMKESTTLLQLLQQHLPQQTSDPILKTALEMEVTMVVDSPPDVAAVWVRTSYHNKPPPNDTPAMQDRLRHLQEKLYKCNPKPELLQCECKEWSAEAGAAADARYLTQLTAQLATVFTNKINNIVAKRKSLLDKCKTVKPSLLSDLHEHQNYYRRVLAASTPRQNIQREIQSYVDSNRSGVVCVFGSDGAGLTTVVIRAATQAKERHPSLILIARTVGVSSECSNVGPTVRALIAHCCAVYGGNAADCTKGVHRTRHLLQQCLATATSLSPVLVVLDGVRHATGLDWLPLPLPQYSKMIISCSAGGDTEKILRAVAAKGGAVIEVPAVEKEELAPMARCFGCCSGCCPSLGPSMVTQLREQLTVTSTPLQLQLSVREWQLTSSPSSSGPVLRETLVQQLDSYCTVLETCFGYAAVKQVSGLLCASVRGLSWSELQDLLSCDQEAMEEHFAAATDPNKLERFPCWMLCRLQHALEPFLHSVVVSGSPLLRWRHAAISDCLKRRYSGTPELQRAKSAAILEYFQGKHANGEPILDKGTGTSTHRRCLPQPFSHQTCGDSMCGGAGNSSSNEAGGSTLRHAGNAVSVCAPRCCPSKLCGAKCVAANRRRVDEEPRAAFRSSNEAALQQLIEAYTLDHDWLVRKLAASDTEQVVADIDAALLLCKDGLKADLRYLKVALKLSSDALNYDHRQFYAQLYGRLAQQVSTLPGSECCKLRKLVAVCNRPPLASLLPLTPCFVVPAQADSEDVITSTEVLINQLSRLPSNPQHMIALSTEQGQLLVWDTVNRRPVRTLKGLYLPRKFEMIDDLQCLLLCGRELRIYNLDTGELVIKFREVMNQKMPFFGLTRPDSVIALARSRMYVNMMNISNGECVATFKVGEDRFLNSLTVSENGKTCVCGDDTQKASALLVWDLSQRKLLYDLRIPHHEFLTRLAAITSEGHYVACVCKETDEQAANFLVVYDLESGTLFKRWKPGVSTLVLAISTPGVCVVAALEDATVTAYDLVTGNPRWMVKGHSHPVDTIRLDPQGTFVVTYDSTGRDRALRAWDMQTGATLAVWTPDWLVTACEVSSDSRSVVVALAGRADLITLALAHKTLPTIDELSKEDMAPYGQEENRGQEYDLST